MGAIAMTPTAIGSWDVTLGSMRVVFGADAIDALGERVAELGCTRVLLVSDAGVCRAGIADRARASLEARSIRCELFRDVCENPGTGQVEAGTAAARSLDIDGIVAVGGGSSMDCAKGINFLLTNGGKMEDYWGHGKARQPMLPSVGVPTTAGTGSEAQSYTLISQADTGVKMACGDPKAAFRAVILDPTLTATVPAGVVAATGIDAISHAVESYVTRVRNPMSAMFAREAWRLLDSCFEVVIADGANLEARGKMMLGAFLAGVAIEQSMLGAAHACANPLTARYNVTHGHAVGLMLPTVIRFNEGRVGTLYAELEAASLTKGRLADRVSTLRAGAGLPERIRDCAVPEDVLPQLAIDAESQWTAGFNPVPVTRKELQELYESAY